MGGLKSGRLCPLELPFTLLPHLWPSSLRFLYRCALFSNPVLVEASDGSSVSNFSSWVLGDDGRVVVLRFSVGCSEVAAPFCSERHRVQVVFGPNKSSVLVAAGVVGLCSCCLFLWVCAIKPRQAVLRWAIIFKSGSPGRPKLPGSRLSVELGSFFCGKLLLWTWSSLGDSGLGSLCLSSRFS
ncbi:unnamed protein product [Brassica oleracea]